MKVNVHIYNHYDEESRFLLHQILHRVNEILKKGGEIIMDLKVLEDQVRVNTEVNASAVILIQGIAAKLQETAGDPVKVQALADELRASAETLGAAVQANTLPA